MAEERTQRYSEAERASQRENRRRMAAGAKYGASFASQGYRPLPDQGKHALYANELQQRYGAFANPTWQYEERGGVLYRKPFANQTGRIAAQGGTAQWEAAPDYVQRAYQNPERRAWNAAHPDAASRPGGGRDQFLFDRFTSRLPIDPETGLRMNQAGELYDPNMFGRPGYTGGAIGQAGQVPTLGNLGGMGGRQTGGGFMFPGGMGNQGFQTGGGFGYMNPYAQPQMDYSLGQMGGFQNYGVPQFGAARPRYSNLNQSNQWWQQGAQY